MKPLTAFILGLAAATCGREANAAEVIRMPAFEVGDYRPWLYASIPGYEVLSIEDAGTTRSLLEEIQRTGRFLPLLVPAAQATAFTAPSLLFLDRFAREGVLAKAQKSLGLPRQIGVYTEVAEGYAIQFTSPDVVASWQAGQTSPAGLRFYGTAVLAQPSLASWYLDGLANELQLAQVSDRAIAFKPRQWIPADLIPPEELLALTTQTEAIAWANGSAVARNRYLTTAAWFIRWGFFAEGGKHRQGLLDLAASRQPATDPVFQEHFGLTVDQQWDDLLHFAANAPGSTMSLQLPNALASTPLARPTVRSATNAEVARLVGGAYAALAAKSVDPASRDTYQAMARDTLAKAYDQGERDPLLVNALGQLEYQEGHFAQARAHLTAAPVAQPYPLLLEARLRLEEAGSKSGDGKPLSPADLSRVLDPLETSLGLNPHLYQAYRLLADVWMRAETPVPTRDLMLLANGTREYTRTEETDLLLDVILLHLRARRTDVARELVERGLVRSGIETTPFQRALQDLQAALTPFPIPSNRDGIPAAP